MNIFFQKKKRIVSVTVMICLALLFSSCGKNEKTPPFSMEIETKSDIQTNNEDQGTTDLSTYETSVNQLPFDIVMQEIRNNAESEKYLIDDNVINYITEMYENGAVGPYEIYRKMVEEGVLRKAPPTGIVIVRYEPGKMVNNTPHGSVENTSTVQINQIDPETGDVKPYRKFSTVETMSCTIDFYGSDKIVIRSRFNEDFTKLTATKRLTDITHHIGWIDEGGYFTDVSEMIQPNTDFGDVVDHALPSFWGNYIYYIDRAKRTVNRVPLDNLTYEAVEIMATDIILPSIGYVYQICPDGSLSSDARVYYDETMSSAADLSTLGDWISSDSYIGIDNGLICLFEKNESEFVKTADLIPERVGRKNRNPVVSPDREKVAFISVLNGEEGLFTVSIKGGEPQKVQTDYNFEVNPQNYPNRPKNYIMAWE